MRHSPFTIHHLPLLLLLDREAFWKTLRVRGIGWTGVASMAAFVVFACAVYGVVMAAGSRSEWLMLFAAAKLPLLFVGSTAIVALFNWIIATTLGSGLSFRETVALAFAAMVVACWILLALAPVAAFFMLTVMPQAGEGTNADVAFAYRVILLTHVAALALAGIIGNGLLFKGLRAVTRPNCPTAALFAAWMTLFAIVGCQMAWILRPFVGSPFEAVVFMRDNALQQNFFEIVIWHISCL